MTYNVFDGTLNLAQSTTAHATSTHGDVDCNNSVLHCNYYLDIFFCILAIKYKLAFCYTALDIFAVYLLLILASDITD